MSSESNSDEIPVNVKSENQNEDNTDEPNVDTEKTIEITEHDESSESSQTNVEELMKLLGLEKQKVIETDEKLKHVLADFQNLSRKTQSLL